MTALDSINKMESDQERLSTSVPTSTHRCTHMWTRTLMWTCTCTYRVTYMWTFTCTCTHASAPTYEHAHMQTHTHRYTHTWMSTRMCAHRCIHTWMCICTCTHTRVKNVFSSTLQLKRVLNFQNKLRKYWQMNGKRNCGTMYTHSITSFSLLKGRFSICSDIDELRGHD